MLLLIDEVELNGSSHKVVKIRGRITRGLGEGAFYVAKYMDEFERVLGFKPFQGTLNIELVEALEDMSRCRGVVVNPPTPEHAPVLAYRAFIGDGVDVFVVKPFKTKHDSKIIEIVSKHRLRDLLGLKDGDIVEVSIICND